MSDIFHIWSRPDLSVLRSINDVVVFVRAASQYGIDSRKLLAGSGNSGCRLTELLVRFPADTKLAWTR